MLRRIIISAVFLLCFLSAKAAKTDTVSTFSNIMNKYIKAVVVQPETSTSKALPVVYLLHGYGGNYSTWTKDKVTETLADRYQVIIVCPDGAVGSWYFDSPIDKNYRYETYVAKELVQWIDKNYNTIVSPKGRAITGLSMGGHGALYLAIRHQDVFGAVGSMSGGVDIRPFPNNWEISKRLGTFEEYPENWEKNTIVNMVDTLTPGALNLIFDCGTEDFFYKVNCELHDKLLKLKIPHDFTARPGAHNWEYWKNAVFFQLLYFDNFFRRQ